MDFIWAGEREKINQRLNFSINILEKCDALHICAVDFYQIFFDDKLISYGPNRTAAGYTRKRILEIPEDVKKIEIKVLAYNFHCYACDLQPPFFGAEIIGNGNTIYKSSDFTCSVENGRIVNMPKFSSQRGYVEGFDLRVLGETNIETYSVESPKIIDGGEDFADYKLYRFNKINEGDFHGFDSVYCPDWVRMQRFVRQGELDVNSFFIEGTKSGFKEINYSLKDEHTGFIGADIVAKFDCKVFLVFEEITPEGKWTFRRSSCNDFIYLEVKKGRTEFLSAEPYALKLLKILTDGEIEITPSLISYEKAYADFVQVEGNKSFKDVFDSARRTFCQNAVDLFTDCPGRERAGWLCDSYFTAQSERLFTGKNVIEKYFLENFLIAETPDVPKNMLPKCFPAEHSNNLYIPNWALWFILEMSDYLDRTGDRDLVDRSKNVIYSVIEFFEQYINEYGLLENLQSWVFIEWSISNDKNYLKGVNFPSNMLFSYALYKAGELYGDSSLIARSDKIKQKIIELSFNGTFFCDNAVRIDGNLIRCDEHISETCQYYALFFKIYDEKNFSKLMIEDFGPMRDKKFPEIGRSNMFIGNYLRFFWLAGIGEKERVLKECLTYFKRMAEITGTIWEKDTPNASCNHGFASVAAVILLNCICGYKGIKDGKPILEGDSLAEKYGVKVIFNNGR